MKAYVIDTPGAPEVLTLKDIPDPLPAHGQVLIEIAAFGLNRAEAVTRAGGSGNAVKFPRVIGIECVGTVAASPEFMFPRWWAENKKPHPEGCGPYVYHR